MSSPHTQGRLYGSDFSIRAEETRSCVAACLTSGQEAGDVRRLVACWNAFDGIPTEQVEAGGPVIHFVGAKILPLIRRAIEGSGVAPTQSTWADC